MIAVIFEVTPHADRRQDYLDAAAALRPHLEQVEGRRSNCPMRAGWTNVRIEWRRCNRRERLGVVGRGSLAERARSGSRLQLRVSRQYAR